MNNSVVILIILFSLIGITGIALLLRRLLIHSPETDLNKVIQEAGYDYDPKQNIFYSRIDAWQRDYGYCSFYDAASVPLGLIFDCEPVRFEYGGKRWLIELWKGQYGMTTGCEIGVYTAEISESENPDDMLYGCAKKEDLLPIALVLKKNNRVLFRRRDVHWWLTGFILGEFSEPNELTMDIAITLKDREMLYAFSMKLIELGYSGNEIKVMGNTAVFSLTKPRSEQPRKQAKLISRFSQWRNKFFCRQYRLLTNNSRNAFNSISKLKQKSPFLFNRILNMGKPVKLFRKRIKVG